MHGGCTRSGHGRHLDVASDDPLTQVEKLRAAWAAGLDDRARAKWSNARQALNVALFGKWSPYPAWAWRDLTPAQRALKEHWSHERPLAGTRTMPQRMQYGGVAPMTPEV